MTLARHAGERKEGERILGRMTESLITADELSRVSFPDKQVELVRGLLIVREPPGGWHGLVANRLAYRVTAFVQEHEAGLVFAQDTGFRIGTDPDTVRGPDLAFVDRARAPDPLPEGYPELAPDLVAEILSPGDGPADVLAKVADWLEAGVRLVWVLDRHRREGRVYRSDGSLTILGNDDPLDGEDVLPGFRCRLGDLLE